MTAIGNQQYKEALTLIADVPACRMKEMRLVEIEALRGLGQTNRLIALLNPPQNVNEVVEIVSLFLGAGRFDEATKCLQDSKPLVPSGLFEALEAMIAVRGMIQ